MAHAPVGLRPRAYARRVCSASLIFIVVGRVLRAPGFVHGPPCTKRHLHVGSHLPGNLQTDTRRVSPDMHTAEALTRRAPQGGRVAHREELEGGRSVAQKLRQVFSAFGLAALFALSPMAPEQFDRPVYAEEAQILNSEESKQVSLYEQNTPGVVFITNEKLAIEQRGQQMAIDKVPAGTGSGWVFDQDGRIITNFHVIKDAQALTVRFIDGTELPAKVVGADPDSDVAVLKVNVPPKRKSLLKPLVRGQSATLKVGQEVYAIGNPFGLDHTLTKGIVSGVGRTIQSIGGRPIQGAIQTDASINPGNSGGPLLNSQGQVIGMNTVIFSPSGASAGVGFAIPGDTVAARASSILKYGYVKRPSLGLYLSQDGVSQRLLGQEGVVISGVQQGAAAAEAGISGGDIIVSIGDRKVKRSNDIYAELDQHELGEKLSIGILRPEDLDALREGSEVRLRKLSADVLLKEAAPVT